MNLEKLTLTMNSQQDLYIGIITAILPAGSSGTLIDLIELSGMKVREYGVAKITSNNEHDNAELLRASKLAAEYFLKTLSEQDEEAETETELLTSAL